MNDSFSIPYHLYLFLCFSIQSKQETEVLKSCLTKAQLDISGLLDEKRTLLDTIRSLQKQLMASTDLVFGTDETR